MVHPRYHLIWDRVEYLHLWAKAGYWYDRFLLHFKQYKTQSLFFLLSFHCTINQREGIAKDDLMLRKLVEITDETCIFIASAVEWLSLTSRLCGCTSHSHPKSLCRNRYSHRKVFSQLSLLILYCSCVWNIRTCVWNGRSCVWNGRSRIQSLVTFQWQEEN